MYIDINKPSFLQADTIMMTGAESKDLNNWIARGLIVFPTATPTTAGRRFYRMVDIFKIATMVELAMLLPPAISSMAGEKVAEFAEAFQTDSIESTIELLEHRVNTSPFNLIATFDKNKNNKFVCIERTHFNTFYEPYVVVTASHILLKVWKRLDTLIKFENLKTPKVYFQI